MAAIKETYSKLYKVYDKGFAPPEWTKDFVGSPSFLSLAKRCRAYGGAPPLLVEREPVNIAQTRHYNREALRKAFGWEASGYRPGDRAPSVYTPTPVKGPRGKVAHIMNSVGVALDSRTQPDYEYLKRMQPVQRSKELKARLVEAYVHLFECALRIGAEEVVMCYLGGGAFSGLFPELYPKKSYLANFFVPAVRAALRKTKYTGRLSMMGVPRHTLFESLGVTDFRGYFPALLDNLDSEKTLIQNAWDPHSMAGNGNKMDNSLDGYIGRHTAIASLAWPLTNPYISCT
jgi:hypothetical protein